MENREWLNEYSALKQVDQTNPFTVPDGYFSELDERITAAIKLDELKNNISPDFFTVPQNYFEELSGNIQSRIVIEAKLDAENTGFTVPADYFEDLSAQIKSRVFVEEALNDTSEKFTVPQNYFAELNKNILNKTANRETVKRKGAVIRFITSNAFKYATAACIILTIGAGVFFRPSAGTTSSHENSYLHKQLSSLPADEIQGYLQLNVDANDAQHTVSAEGIQVNDNDLKAALQEYADDLK